jgi:signal transduction histidine kinase
LPLLDIPIGALPFPAIILNHEGQIAMANSEWMSVYADCGVGQSFREWCGAVHLHAPDLATALMEGAQRSLDHGERFVQKFGDGEQFLVTITPCNLGALVLHQSLVPAPERARAQRMETMGRLVAGVAHDFANVITLIDGYSDILLGRVPEFDPLRAELEEIRKAVSHGAHLTTQLLSFTRGQAFHPVVLDLNLLIGEMQRMLRPVIGENIILDTELTPNLARVMVDPGQLEQVIVNLILNARDAMPDGGTIHIATANSASRVMISIADTGCGMDPETMGRIFEAFFTT